MQDPLPLLIGGKGDRMLGMVARYADEWNMWGLADTIAERGGGPRAPLRVDRPRPGEIARSAQALFLVTDDEPRPRRSARTPADPRWRARADDIAEAVAAWRGVGLDEVIVPDFTLGAGRPPRAHGPHHRAGRPAFR